MSVNFFEATCRKTVSDIKFGICDDDNTEPAYIDTAIDNCIEILRDNGNMDNRCDVMLNYESNLLFVELKTKRTNWKAEGLGQIEATIKKMLVDAPDFYNGFRKRKAVVANSRNAFPRFHDYDTEQREYFQKKYKMRIQFEAEIVII